MGDIHRVDSPENQCEASNGSEERLGLSVLVGSSSTAVESELVDDDEVGKAGNGVPSPLLAISATVGSKETSEDHDQVGHDGDEDAGTVETGEQGQVEEQKWRGHGPVDVSCPVDLTVGGLVCVWNVLVCLGLDSLVVVDTCTAGHGEVGEEGEGGDEGSQDVEEAFLLECVSLCSRSDGSTELTTGTLKAIP